MGECGVRLTAAERATITGPGGTNDWLKALGGAEAVIAARLREHRRDWASWLENWTAAVGPEPPTVEAVIRCLRADWLPFGVAAAQPDDGGDAAAGEGS